MLKRTLSILSFLLLSCSLLAVELSPSERERLLIDEFRSLAGLPELDSLEPTNQNQVENQKTTTINKPTPTPAPKPKLSRGEKAIQAALAKNRERIKEMREKKKSHSPTDLKITGDNFENINQRWLWKIKNKNQLQVLEWEKKKNETLANWKKQHQKFLSQFHLYKNGMHDMGSFLVSSEKRMSLHDKFNPSPSKSSRTYDVYKTKDMLVLPGAFKLTVKDQGARSTCAAFAGVRAIELLYYAKERRRIDLSEQFFFWLSRSECRQSPCRKRGSWVRDAFQNSVSQNISIPVEDQCPYQWHEDHSNITQIPLKGSCHRPGNLEVKVGEHQQLSQISQITDALEKGYPVIVGLKLDQRFYENRGMVAWKNPLSKRKMDSHSKGHAVVIVGRIDLKGPVSEESTQCFLITNSWGEGWGLGGHSCLTRSYLQRQLLPNALISLNRIQSP